jgi:hypothetical protein
MQAKPELTTGAMKSLARKSRVQDRDDELGLVVQAIIDCEMTTLEISQAALKLNLHVSAATLDAWLAGKVKTPQNRTVFAVFAGMGWQTRRIPPKGWRNPKSRMN